MSFVGGALKLIGLQVGFRPQMKTNVPMLDKSKKINDKKDKKDKKSKKHKKGKDKKHKKSKKDKKHRSKHS